MLVVLVFDTDLRSKATYFCKVKLVTKVLLMAIWDEKAFGLM